MLAYFIYSERTAATAEKRMDIRRSAYVLIGEIGIGFAAIFVRVIFVLVAAAFLLLIVGGVN